MQFKLNFATSARNDAVARAAEQASAAGAPVVASSRRRRRWRTRRALGRFRPIDTVAGRARRGRRLGRPRTARAPDHTPKGSLLASLPPLGRRHRAAAGICVVTSTRKRGSAFSRARQLVRRTARGAVRRGAGIASQRAAPRSRRRGCHRRGAWYRRRWARRAGRGARTSCEGSVEATHARCRYAHGFDCCRRAPRRARAALEGQALQAGAAGPGAASAAAQAMGARSQPWARRPGRAAWAAARRGGASPRARRGGQACTGAAHAQLCFKQILEVRIRSLS